MALRISCSYVSRSGVRCGVIPRGDNTMCAKHMSLPTLERSKCKIDGCERFTTSRMKICTQHQRKGYNNTNASGKLCEYKKLNHCRSVAVDGSDFCARHGGDEGEVEELEVIYLVAEE